MQHIFSLICLNVNTYGLDSCIVFGAASKLAFFFFALAYLCTIRDRIIFLRILLFELEGRNLLRKPNISTYSFPYKIVKIITPKAIN